MAVAALSVIEVSFRGVVDQQSVITTRTYANENSIPDPTTPRQLQDLFLATIQAGQPNDLVTDYLAVCATDYLLTRLRVQIVKPVRIAAVEAVLAGAGTRVGVTQATNINGTITFRSSLAGRKEVATIHPPALPEGEYINGNLTVGMRAALTALGEKFSENVVIAAPFSVWRPVIFHRTALPGAQFSDINSFAVGETVRVMRRRTVGLGI